MRPYRNLVSSAMLIWDTRSTLWVSLQLTAEEVLPWKNVYRMCSQAGIRDMFHRYRADLSLMSPDSKLFVRSIEQVVTIYVDKFPSSGNVACFTSASLASVAYQQPNKILLAVHPVPERYVEQHFAASHPFLYFVMDRNSGVSLVAGILSNPSKHII